MQNEVPDGSTEKRNPSPKSRKGKKRTQGKMKALRAGAKALQKVVASPPPADEVKGDEEGRAEGASLPSDAAQESSAKPKKEKNYKVRKAVRWQHRWRGKWNSHSRNGWNPSGTKVTMAINLTPPPSFPESSAELLYISKQYQHPPYLEHAMAKDFDRIRRLQLQDNVRAANGIVKRACMRLGNCSILRKVIWIDPWKGMHSMSLIRNTLEHRNRKTNHFPGMIDICNKCTFTELIKPLQQEYPEAFSFYPRSWNLDGSVSTLKLFNEQFVPGDAYILKPGSGLQGGGITLTKSKEVVLSCHSRMRGRNFVCQEYIDNPALLEGYKFDFRIYVLVAELWPLTAYVFHEGLTRVATAKYAKPNDENIHQSFMHMTNYSLNKKNTAPAPASPSAAQEDQESIESAPPAAQADDDEETPTEAPPKHTLKLKISQTLLKLKMDPKVFWGEVDSVVTKTLLAIHPALTQLHLHAFPERLDPSDSAKPTKYEEDPVSNCFQMIGFDLMASDDLTKLHLLEINQNPSLYCAGSKLDSFIKESVFAQALRLLDLVPGDAVPKPTSGQGKQQASDSDSDSEIQEDENGRVKLEFVPYTKILNPNLLTATKQPQARNS